MGFDFRYEEPQNRKSTHENLYIRIVAADSRLQYYDDMLRAYKEHKTTKIRFQGLITNLTQTKISRCTVYPKIALLESKM